MFWFCCLLALFDFGWNSVVMSKVSSTSGYRYITAATVIMGCVGDVGEGAN